MNRTSTTREIANLLGIGVVDVNNHIRNGLFLSTHHAMDASHFLNKDECLWAWTMYERELKRFDKPSNLEKAVARKCVILMRDEMSAKEASFVIDSEGNTEWSELAFNYLSKIGAVVVGVLLGVVITLVIDWVVKLLK